MAGNVAKELRDLEVPVESLRPYGRNPRRGDVDAIAESLRVNGQYRPVVVREETREVLAGNHTLQAAKSLGWDTIAAVFVEADDEQAARIVLVDNRVNDLATYNDAAVLEVIERAGALPGTGWDEAEIERLVATLEPAVVEAPPPSDPNSTIVTKKVTFSAAQADLVQEALAAAKRSGDLERHLAVNPNKNGSALALVCEVAQELRRVDP